MEDADLQGPRTVLEQFHIIIGAHWHFFDVKCGFLFLAGGNSPTEESMKVAKPKIAPRTGLCFVHLVGSSLLPGPFRMKLSCQESVLHLSWQQA